MKAFIGNVLTLEDLHKRYTPNDITNELQNSNYSPGQIKCDLVRYI
jgi:hypothetical protein